MKNIVYIRLTTISPHSKKNIIKRTTEKIFGSKDEKMYSATGIYDERLVRTGTLVEYYLKDKTDNVMLERYYDDIHNIVLGENCKKASFEDAKTAFNYPYEMNTGEKCILQYEINKLLNDNIVNPGEFIGVIVSGDTDLSLLRMISDFFRYIIVYSKNMKDCEIIAEDLKRYNSTAVIISDRLYSLKDTAAIVSLVRKCHSPESGYTGKFIYVYPDFVSQPEDVITTAYSENFLPIRLSASFTEEYTSSE